MDFPYLSFLTFFPLVGAVIILVIPKGKEELIRWTALITTIPPLAVAFKLFFAFDRTITTFQTASSFQFVEGPYSWIPAFNIEYFMGADGASISMILLTPLIAFVCILASWNIKKAVKGYFTLFLLLDTGMIGVFCALDFFLFFVFWEIMLLPMYFLIGIWGSERREYAAIKFFLFTLLGSVMMLLVMIGFYLFSDGNVFNLVTLAKQEMHRGILLDPLFRNIAWIALFIGFAIKIPAVPFHTWLPDAHVEAPTAISVILAGILLKMGIYGILRICYPLLPDATATFAQFIVVMGVINIVYGALCAMAQKDFKKLIAYSSISHMGFCMLGMASFTPEGMNGAVLQMFNHGTITAQLFLIVGIIYDRAHHRRLDGFGGLATTMPRYAALTGLAFFAALGLPGLSGFISEALCFIGGFKTWRLYTIISASGVIITAGYMLWCFQRVFLGAVNEKYKGLPDINGREMLSMIPLALIVILVGVYPKVMLDLLNTSLVALNSAMKPYIVALAGM